MSDTTTPPAGPLAGPNVKKILLLVALAAVVWWLCRDKTAGPPPVPAA